MFTSDCSWRTGF